MHRQAARSLVRSSEVPGEACQGQSIGQAGMGRPAAPVCDYTVMNLIAGARGLQPDVRYAIIEFALPILFSSSVRPGHGHFLNRVKRIGPFGQR